MAKLYKGQASFGNPKIYLAITVVMVAIALYYMYDIFCLQPKFGTHDTSGATVAIILLALSNIPWRKYRIMESGVSGEERNMDILASLPSDYHVLTNVKIANTELDAIVVGPNGVFLVEVKNYGGQLETSYSGSWTQKKRGHSNSIKNPIKQLNWHSKELVSFLRSHGIKAWVDSRVFLSNPDVSVDNLPNRCLDSASSLRRWIEDYQARHEIDEKEVIEIVDLLKGVQ